MAIFIGIASLLGLNGCFTTTTGDPTPSSATKTPTALFTYVIGSSGIVTFTNNSVNATSYLWDFGDGKTSTYDNPDHQYAKNGTYSVTLKANGAVGTNSFTQSVVITNSYQTTIRYYNYTATPITISVNGKTQTIKGAGLGLVEVPYIDFMGEPSSAAGGSAFTSGLTSNGTQIGAKISWTISNTFPSVAVGNLIVKLNVSSSYFFVYVTNASNLTISKLYSNFELTSQTLDNIFIPNDGKLYSMGYYNAYSNSNVRLEASNGSYWYWTSSNLSLPFIENQAVSLQASK